MPLGLACRDWLLGLARVEADSGCPRLFAMKSEIAMYFADTVAHWGTERRYHLMCACIKRLFDNNYGFPSLPWTEEESAAWADWDYPFMGRDLGLGAFRSPGKPGAELVWATSGKKRIIDADKVPAVLRWEHLEFGGGFKINKRLLKTTLKQTLHATLGAPEVVGSLWRYRTTAPGLPGLMITTNLDFGGRHPSQLRYSQWLHQIRGQDAAPRWLLDHGGISALLGWPQTEWCYLTDADVPAAARLLAELSKEFVDAVPGMWRLSGLHAAMNE